MKIFSAEIFWKDNPTEIISANFGVGVVPDSWFEENEALDNKIFFYADTEQELARLTKSDNGEDFVILANSLSFE